MIREIISNKKDYLNFLLLADESEKMIDTYIDRGRMFILSDNGKDIAEILITEEEKDILEIKNLAVLPQYQKRGYGKAIINFIINEIKGYKVLRVGTGESPLTLPFYKKLGFKEKYRIPDFFKNNYPYPITECGITLKDMVVLERTLV